MGWDGKGVVALGARPDLGARLDRAGVALTTRHLVRASAGCSLVAWLGIALSEAGEERDGGQL